MFHISTFLWRRNVNFSTLQNFILFVFCRTERLTESVNIYISLYTNIVWRIFKPSKHLKQWNNEICDRALYIY